MEKVTILVVDDEQDIVDLIKFNLKRTGYEVLEAYDGEEALVVAKNNHVDLILLDWMLPKKDGIDVCRELKRDNFTKNIPVIMVSAKNEEFDVVLALEIGADDYISKPFSVRELLARVKVVLKRYKDIPVSEEEGLISVNGLVIDKNRHAASFDGKNLGLTKTEFDLLLSLATHKTKAYTREQLLHKVWGADFYGDNRVVDVHIRRLRSKIEEVTSIEFVRTVRGVGYKFAEF
ncbi:MAG: response regulator [Acidaminococcaceae bacterium]|nr:response regulator [Acidaminococcaceae bacterium]MDD4527025.1 response regulator [Candidatus Margulisiibacteriota bacterium]